MTEPQTGAVTETEPETAFADLEVDAPLVGIIMGSKSDLPEMEKAGEVLAEKGIRYEIRVMSAHRDPETVADYCRNARMRGLRVIIAGAGLSAALPGRRRGPQRPAGDRRPALQPPQRARRPRRDPVDRADAARRPGRLRRPRQRAQRRPSAPPVS